jgi:hypothetical protein
VRQELLFYCRMLLCSFQPLLKAAKLERAISKAMKVQCKVLTDSATINSIHGILKIAWTQSVLIVTLGWSAFPIVAPIIFYECLIYTSIHQKVFDGNIPVFSIKSHAVSADILFVNLWTCSFASFDTIIMLHVYGSYFVVINFGICIIQTTF